MASYDVPMTDEEILASGVYSKRSHVLPESRSKSLDVPVEDIVSEDPLMESMDVEPVYQVGQPKVESLIVQDKINRDSSEDDEGFWNQFYGSLETTIFQDNPRLSGRAIEGMGRVSGIDSMRELGENIVAEYDASPPEEKFVPRVSNYKDVDGLNSALDYMGSTIGQGVGSIAMTVGGAVAGAGLGAAGGAAVGAVGGGVGAVPGAALGAVGGGATGGAVAGSFLLNYGDTYEYLVEQEGVDPDKAAELALVPGTIMAGLDAFAVGKLLGPAKRQLSSNIIKRTGQLAVRGAGTEGATEAAQQVIQESSGEIAEALGYATEDIEFAQRFDSVVNAMIAGALTGGAMGGATSPFKKPTDTPTDTPTPVESAFTDDNIDVVTDIARPGFAYFTHSIGGGMQNRRMGLMGGLDTLGSGIADVGVLFNVRDTEVGPRFRPFLHSLGFMAEGDVDGRSLADNLRIQIENRQPYLHDAPVSFLYELPIPPDVDVRNQTIEMDGKTTVSVTGKDQIIADASKRLGEPGTEAASTIAERILGDRGVSRGRGLNSVLPSEYIRGVFVSGEFISLEEYRSRVQLTDSAPPPPPTDAEAAAVEVESEVLEAPEVGSVAPFTSRTDWEMELSEVMSDPDSEYHIHTGKASAADFLSEGLRLKAGRENFRGPGETLYRTLDEIISEGRFRATAWNMLGGPEAVKKAYSGGIVNISQSLEQGVVGSARGNTVVFKLPKGKTLGDVAEAIPGVDLARVKKNPKQTVSIARLPPKYIVAFIDRSTGELTKYKAPVEAAPEAEAETQGFDTIEDFEAQRERERSPVDIYKTRFNFLDQKEREVKDLASNGLISDSELQQELNRIEKQRAIAFILQKHSESDEGRIPTVKAPTRIIKLENEYRSGNISQEKFEKELSKLAGEVSAVSMLKEEKQFEFYENRETGPDIVREKLIAGRRRGEIDPEMTEMALWFLDQNPNVASALAISLRKTPDKRAPGKLDKSGEYHRNPAGGLMRIFKTGGGKTGTAVHEMLHHTERMMPEDVRQGIAKSYLSALSKEINKKSTTDVHLAYLRFIAGEESVDPTTNKKIDKAGLNDAISNGKIPRDYYQYFNPSEFWAVNATRILDGRYQVRGTWVSKAKQYLIELAQKAKSIFGLQSDAPILRGLQSVLDGDGTIISKDMLATDVDIFGDIEDVSQPPAAANPLSPDIAEIRADPAASQSVLETLDVMDDLESGRKQLREGMRHLDLASYIRNMRKAAVDEYLESSAKPPATSDPIDLVDPNTKVVDESGKPLLVFHGTPKGRFNKAARESNAERKRIFDERARLDQAYNDLNVEYKRLASIAKQKLAEQEEYQKAFGEQWRAETGKKYGPNMGIIREDPEWLRLDQIRREALRDKGVFHNRKMKPFLDAKRDLPSPPKERPVEEVFGTRRSGWTDAGYRSVGSYFSESREGAEGYARNRATDPIVYEVYLNLLNPYEHGVTKTPEGMIEEINRRLDVEKRNAGRNWLDEQRGARAKVRRQVLEEYGFDGEIWMDRGLKEYIAFEPEQVIIKDAKSVLKGEKDDQET